jgi:hypothetical protein
MENKEKSITVEGTIEGDPHMVLRPSKIDEPLQSKGQTSAQTTTRMAPPRPSGGSGGEDANKYWQRLDSLFDSTVRNAETAYRTNLWINKTVVAIGVVLIVYSLIYSAFKGADLSAVTFAGLGIVSFIATFFTSSQKMINKNVAKLVDIQMLYRSYCRIEEATGDWDRENQKKTLRDLEEMNNNLATNTKELSDKIVEIMKLE